MAEKLEKPVGESDELSKQNVVSSSIFMLFGDVDIDVSKDVCTWILAHNFSTNKPEILNLIINSPGGDLNGAFAIIDIMASSKIPIRTIGLGQIASAGLMIFLAGTQGERLLTPNTSILSHQYSWGSEGKFHELIAIKKEFDLTNERMMALYIKTTGLPKAKIEKYLLPPEDVYLSAEDALKYKLCDRIALLS